MPLDEFEGAADILAKATPSAVEESKGPDGHIYALPAFADAFGFAYNTDTFNAAGFDKPGATLDELRTQMEKVKAEGIEEYPLSLGMKKQAGQFWSLWATLYASGGDMFDPEGKPAFESADSPLKDILDWYVAAYNDWKIVGLEDLQRDWGSARTNIRSGAVRAGYMAQFALTEFNARPDSAVSGKIKIALVPGLNGNDVGTVGYAHGVGIAANTQDKDTSWKLLDAYAGPGADGSWAMTRARALDQGGRCPFPALYNSPELQELITKITLGDTADFNKLSDLSRAKQGIKAPWYPEWEQGFMSQVQDALLKSTTVEAAIKASADLARKLAV
jgi:ABC-type glycerol-3-phosphate transport system substrate-binding protein